MEIINKNVNKFVYFSDILILQHKFLTLFFFSTFTRIHYTLSYLFFSAHYLFIVLFYCFLATF